MPSFSSYLGDGPGGDGIAEINARMVDQLLGQAPAPLAEGRYAVRVLESRGRVTGRPRRTPLGLLQLDGRHYLVSPDRRRDWVRNLAGQPRCTLLDQDGAQPRRAVPVAGTAAATVVAAYLSAVTVPWALRAFPVRPGASAEEIAGHLDALAVFRLDPGDGR